MAFNFGFGGLQGYLECAIVVVGLTTSQKRAKAPPAVQQKKKVPAKKPVRKRKALPPKKKGPAKRTRRSDPFAY